MREFTVLVKLGEFPLAFQPVPFHIFQKLFFIGRFFIYLVYIPQLCDGVYNTTFTLGRQITMQSEHWPQTSLSIFLMISSPTKLMLSVCLMIFVLMVNISLIQTVVFSSRLQSIMGKILTIILWFDRAWQIFKT